jgi:hypothetical protein
MGALRRIDAIALPGCPRRIEGDAITRGNIIVKPGPHDVAQPESL